MKSTYVAVTGTCLAIIVLLWPSAFAAGGASRCDRQIVMQIDAAKISAGPDGFEIDAFGTSESAGWSNPRLIVASAPASGVATVDFVACRPEVSATVLTPIQVRETLKLDFVATRKIVIRARANSMEVDIGPR